MPNLTVAKNYGSLLVASQPSVPDTTVALANPTGWDCFVYIYSGTVSEVHITPSGGSATQAAAATNVLVRIAAGDSITLTYSSKPSWSWWYVTALE